MVLREKNATETGKINKLAKSHFRLVKKSKREKKQKEKDNSK